jgi:hypothetical protein
MRSTANFFWNEKERYMESVFRSCGAQFARRTALTRVAREPEHVCICRPFQTGSDHAAQIRKSFDQNLPTDREAEPIEGAKTKRRTTSHLTTAPLWWGERVLASLRQTGQTLGA